MSTAPRYFSNLGAQAAARVLMLLSTVVVMIACARHLGVDAFGEFAYAMAFMALVGVIADAGTTAVLACELPRHKSEHAARAYLGNFLLVRIGLGAAASLIGTGGALLLSAHDHVTLLIAALAAPFGTARFFDPLFQVFEQPWRAIPVALGTSILYLGGSLAALFLLPSPITGLIVVYGLSGLAHILLGLRNSHDLVRPELRPDRNLLRAIAALAVPIGISTIFSAANGRIGTILLAELDSATSVGNFTAAAKLVELGAMVAMTLWAPLLPILATAARAPNGLRTAARSLFETIGVLGLPAVIVLWFIAPWLLHLLFGAAYGGAAEIAAILVWQLMLLPFTLIGSAVLLSAGSLRVSYWLGIVATALNGAINVALIPSLGPLATAIGAVAAEAAILIIIAAVIRRHVGKILFLTAWGKIAILNIGLYLLLANPLLPNALLNGAVALVVYALLAQIGGLVPHQHLRAILMRTSSPVLSGAPSR